MHGCGHKGVSLLTVWKTFILKRIMNKTNVATGPLDADSTCSDYEDLSLVDVPELNADCSKTIYLLRYSDWRLCRSQEDPVMRRWQWIDRK